jgi:integrase
VNCPKCRKETPDGALFCPWCGKKLASTARKAKRSPNGTGSAYKRGSGWTAQAVIGYRPLPQDLADPSNAHQRIPIKRTKAGFATKAEALAYVPTLLSGGYMRPKTAPTLQYYWNNYEAGELTQLSDSKQTAYKIAWGKLSTLHESVIDQLTVQDLRNAVSSACSTYYTAKDCRTVLAVLFRIAAADGYANKDLPSFIQLPALTEKEREPFSDTEQASLWKLYESGDIRAAVPLLMIYTGLMPGECFDLTVDMIDLPNRQIVGAGKKTKVRKKTPVTIAASIIPVLEDLMAHSRPSGRLFSTSEDKWREDYYAALEAAHCRRLQPYSCRHTTATALAIDNNIAPQTIQKVMRWSTTKMLDRYAHPAVADVQAAVDAIGS